MTDKAATNPSSAKTALRLLAGSNNPIWIKAWGVSFNDATASDLPTVVELLYESVASTPTGTTGVATDYRNDGGTSAVTLTNALHCSAEGSPTLVQLDTMSIPTTSGTVMWYPLGSEIKIPVSKGFRIRLTGPASTPTCNVFAIWEE